TPGERVVVQTEKSPEAVFFYLACLRAGAVYVPQNTAYRADEMDYFIADAEPKAVLCDPALLAQLEPICKARNVPHLLTLDAKGGGTLIETSTGLSGDFPAVPRAGKDLAAILYSSGTTGQPKGVMLSHDNLAANARALHQLWRFQPGDVLLHALPI